MTTTDETRSAESTGAIAQPFDVERIRADFPILRRDMNGHALVYLDNAATTQKPRLVLDTIVRYYSEYNANVHRGVHQLSQEATEAHENARIRVQRLLGAKAPEEIVFTRGTTESINLVAQSYGRSTLRPGDEVLVTEMEHHSNLVPWQIVCEQTGATLRWIPIDDRGTLRLETLDTLLSERTKIVAVGHVSNALGTVNPVREIVDRAHAVGAVVVVDGAQAVPHGHVDVKALGADFYAFSSHKVYGPTGVGALYGRHELLDAMPPWEGGGEMILSVTMERTTYSPPPHKFEAGTPNIAGAIGLGAAIDYVERLGLDAIAAHEAGLLAYGTSALAAIDGLTIIGTAPQKAGVLSFVLEGIHPHDVGTILDQEGIAVRTGHHCAQPVMQHFGIPATARASFGLYTTRAEIDALVRGIHKVKEVFA